MVRPLNKEEILEVIPEKRVMPLKNLYLNQGLHNISENLGGSIAYTNYICDLNEVIAVKDQDGFFRVPKALRNQDDWRLFQELEAQADVIITSKAYLGRFAAEGENAQNVLTEFEAGSEFEDLGEWRLKSGFKSRRPDLAIVGRRPDIIIPESAMQAGRNLLFFTTYVLANSDDAKRLGDSGVTVVGAGAEGVEGKVMIDYLATRGNYRTIYAVAGPSIVKILLDARVLDRLYVTQVNRNILFDDPSSVKRILSNGKISGIPGFILTKRYLQDRVVTEDLTITTQEFLLYENFGISPGKSDAV